jgi:hypothetical protein
LLRAARVRAQLALTPTELAERDMGFADVDSLASFCLVRLGALSSRSRS